ncbi:MAG: alanine--tRNA ligase, partial [Rickettsiales bacterium]|nr:alanine--tRNA ligase [Rickettsiales bacterium]
KYGEEVRVVSMGKLDMLGGVEAKDGDYSIELCGGTHVNRTGDIGFFKITGVSTVAANVKRIEALTGVKATNYVLDNQSVLDQLSGMLSTTSDAISSRIDALLKEGKEQKSLIDNLRHQIALGGGGAKGSANDDIKEINGTKLVAKTMQDFPAKNLRSIADDLMAKIKSGVVALVAVNDGKAAILVSVSEDLTSKYNAVELVKAGVETLGGKGGGGRPDFAQGGGPDGTAADKAIEVIESKLA